MAQLEDRLHLDFVVCHHALNARVPDILVLDGLSQELDFGYDVLDIPESTFFRPNASESFPENAIVYVHGNREQYHLNFTYVLCLSRQRPDLRFIMEMRDAYEERSLFQDEDSYKAFIEIVKHDPNPSLPVSISHKGFDEYFEKSRHEFHFTCDRYIRQYVEMKRAEVEK